MTAPSERDSETMDENEEAPEALGEGLLEENMGPSSAAAHLYRGEIHRMKFWRERLDQTTYWAVVIMSAFLTWTFSSTNNPHYILLLGLIAVTVFLFIEARRFQGYDIWRGRVRTLQRNVFAYGLNPSAGLEDPDWREKLSEDYRRPTIKISTREAVAHRLRRIYLPLFTVLLGGWLIRVVSYTSRPWPESAAIGRIPGVVVTAAVAAYYLAAVLVALRPGTRLADDELVSKDVGRHR